MIAGHMPLPSPTLLAVLNERLLQRTEDMDPNVALFEIREHLFISVLAVPKTRLIIIVLALGRSYSLQSSLQF